MELFIAEKPDLGRGIAKHLGKSIVDRKTYVEVDGGRKIVTWSFGHIFATKDPDFYIGTDENGNKRRWSFDTLPVVPQSWKLQCTNPAQFKVIKGLLKSSSSVVVAGDPDREGQLLIDEILLEAGVNPSAPNIKRIWLSALDDASVVKALSQLKPNREYEPLRNAALSRQRADWLTGMNYTRAFSVAAGGLVRVGRVKTPTLAMVVNRDLEILNFTPKDYFVPWVVLNGVRLNYKKLLVDVGQAADSEGRIVDSKLANQLVGAIKNGMPWEVVVCDSRQVKTGAPLPHSLDSLQSLLSQTHSMSAASTLAAAQSLYEKHKVTTYPRTDSRYLPKSMGADVSRIMKSIHPLYSKEVSGCTAKSLPKCFNDGKVTAHHAIIPTGAHANVSSFSNDEKAVFDAVCRYYIAQFYDDAEFLKTSLEVNFGGKAIFSANESELMSPGWKTVLGRLDTSESEEKENVDG